MENQKHEFGTKIKSVSDDVKQKILEGIEKNVGQGALITRLLKEKKKVLDKDLANATDEKAADHNHG